MTDKSANEATGGRGLQPAYRAGDRSQSSNSLVAILLAVLLAAATGLLVYRYQSTAPPWLLGVASVLAFCGLFALLGGRIHLHELTANGVEIDYCSPFPLPVRYGSFGH